MIRPLPLLILASLCLGAAPGVFARANSVANLQKAAEAIPERQVRLQVQGALTEFDEAAQLRSFFGDCYGVAIFPTVGKGGIGLGGAHGTGWVFREGRLTGRSKMTQVTFGLQLGGQAFAQIIFFADEEAFNRFTNGNFELGAQASAVAITAGANASASTAGGAASGAGDSQAKRRYTDGIAIFTKAKGGLMYEASVGGQKFTYRSVK